MSVAFLLLLAGILLGYEQCALAQGSESPHTKNSVWNFTYRYWQMRDGLPASTVEAFAETPDGYLWIGTQGGLVRFDGAHFKVFNHENTPAFHSDEVYCLLADRTGDLWIGTIGVGTGGLIELRNGVFRRYASADGLNTDFVRGLLEDHRGRIWVAMDGGLAWVRDGRLVNANVASGSRITGTFALLEDHTEGIWVTAGLHLYDFHDPDTGACPQEYTPFNKDSRLREMSLLETRDGTIWLGTVSGLLRKPRGKCEFEKVAGIHSTVRALFRAPNGEIWAGTAGEGVVRIRDGRVVHGEPQIPLPSHTVYAIFGDSEQNVWIGTLGGMVRLSPTPVHLVPLPKAAGSDFGTVALDTDDSLWAASTQLVHVVGDRVHRVSFSAIGNARVRTITRARDGALWIGTDGRGAFRLIGHKVWHILTDQGLHSDFVRAMLEDRSGAMWIGEDGGLSRVEGTTVRTFTKADGYDGGTVHALAMDRDGSMWVGSDGGLFHFRGDVQIQDTITRTLHHQRVLSLYESQNGDLWVGTQMEGLFLYSNGQLWNFTKKSGLPSNAVYSVLDDNQGHVWISSRAGVMLATRSEFNTAAASPGHQLSFQFFSALESNPPAIFYDSMYPEAVLTHDHAAWFATSKGLWRIQPNAVEHNFLNKLSIEDVTVDGRAIPVASSMALDAGSKRLEIAYAAILLSSQKDVRYRYMLKGYDHTWVYANAGNRLATYTNLPAGAYQFSVQAWETNYPDHVVTASLRLVKRQYFYQTLWFEVLCAMCLVIISLGLYRLKVVRMQDRFHAALAERARLAREMHDTLIQGCVGVSTLLKAASSSDIDDEEDRAHILEYAATQIHATVDEARQAVWNLRSDESAPIDLDHALQNMGKRICAEHRATMVYKVSGASFPLSARATHELLMIVRESVFNAILHGEATRIDVAVSYLPNMLIMTIQDNGNGFDVSAAIAEGHFGLRGMQERIQRMNGKIQITSTAGSGTEVRIEVPRVALIV